MFHQLALIAVPDFPLVEPGNEPASMISDACLKAGIAVNAYERSPNGMSFGSSIRGANNAKSEGIRDDRACL
jgi:hypothetical protein